MPVKSKIGGIYRDVPYLYSKVSGAWRSVGSEWVKVGGQWRKSYDAKFNTYFEPYIHNVGELTQGSYEHRSWPTIGASVHNALVNDGNRPFHIGWRIKNIPPNSTVVFVLSLNFNGPTLVEFVVAKQGQRWDTVNLNVTSQQRMYSQVTGEMELYAVIARPAGWSAGFVEFDVERVLINNEQIFP